jgi:hypothetical protein
MPLMDSGKFHAPAVYPQCLIRGLDRCPPLPGDRGHDLRTEFRFGRNQTIEPRMLNPTESQPVGLRPQCFASLLMNLRWFGVLAR